VILVKGCEQLAEGCSNVILLSCEQLTRGCCRLLMWSDAVKYDEFGRTKTAQKSRYLSILFANNGTLVRPEQLA